MIPHLPRLRNKVAIVLGASSLSGMGAATARRFAEEGAKVVVSGRREAPLHQLADEIGGSACRCDITRQADIDALAAFTLERYGGIDIAINTAATGLLRQGAENSEEEIRQMLDVNYVGPFLFLQAMVRDMVPGGSVIMVTTASVTAIFEGHAAYAGAKAGTEHLVRAFAYEQGRRGIRINAIAPGVTQSEMTAEFLGVPGVREAFEAEYPLGRLGTVEDVAAAAAFLASNECFMTGEILQVNGGLTLRRNPTPSEIQTAMTSWGRK